MSLVDSLPDVSDGRIRMNKTRLIVGLITPHRKYLIITKPVGEAIIIDDD
jgi:hypothetical protein